MLDLPGMCQPMDEELAGHTSRWQVVGFEYQSLSRFTSILLSMPGMVKARPPSRGRFVSRINGSVSLNTCRANGFSPSCGCDPREEWQSPAGSEQRERIKEEGNVEARTIQSDRSKLSICSATTRRRLSSEWLRCAWEKESV
jgi:hypothetical protein